MLIRRERCPQCAKHGKDTRGNNLAVYNDHSYCYGCGYNKYHGPIVRNQRSILRSSIIGSHSPDLSNFNITADLPSAALRWISSYGITPKELIREHVVYDSDRDLLILPVYDGNKLVSYNARYFGTNEHHPKYLHFGKKQYVKLFVPPVVSDVFVLVEDFISALKVGRQFNSIPLFGSTISQTLILSLVYQIPRLRIWLDRDKASEAINQAAKARQFIQNIRTILTDRDPKDHTDLEIRTIVESTLSPNQSISQL